MNNTTGILNKDVVAEFGDDIVAFVNSEDEARELLLAPGELVIGTIPNNPFKNFPESLRVYYPVMRKEITRIQVDYVGEVPFRVKQMSVLEWRKRLGLLKERRQEKIIHTTNVRDLAGVMMANGVR